MCGANLAMPESCWRWWLRNTWTDVANDYREGPGSNVFDWMVPCSSEIPTGASGDGPGIGMVDMPEETSESFPIAAK